MNFSRFVDCMVNARRMSVPALLKELHPPGWKFWIDECRRAAAADLLGEKADADGEVNGALARSLHDDPSEDVRIRAAIGIARLAHMGQLRGLDPTSALELLHQELAGGRHPDHTFSVIRAIGLLGKRARREEESVRTFLQQKMESGSVSFDLMLVCTFALARVSADPSGPMQGMGKMLTLAKTGNQIDQVLDMIRLLGCDARPLVPALRSKASKESGIWRGKLESVIALVSGGPET